MGAHLSTQGPCYRCGVFCGQRCCCGYLASRCKTPLLTAKATGCTRVTLLFEPLLPVNLFHEEVYICAWREVNGADWHEFQIDESECTNVARGRVRVQLMDLPVQTQIQIRLCAANRHGRSGWSEEVGIETLAQPTRNNGFSGQLGPAGEHCRSRSYEWEQTQDDVSFKILIPEEWRSHDLKFKVTQSRLEIIYVGRQTSNAQPLELLPGAFPAKVLSEDYYWEIETNDQVGRHISAQLPKKEQGEKWSCLLVAHTHIDVQLVRFSPKSFKGLDIYG